MSKILANLTFPLKLEVGSGMNPQPGYTHLDVDPNFPDIEIVCDLAKEKIPLQDATVSDLLANHLIEHVHWRVVDSLVKEWFRVLIPGGKIFLRTPDLEFICKTYLAGKTTPEWPGDEAAAKTIFGECGPAEWANIKLFSGGDYAGNFHHLCFDFQMLEKLLKKAGFENIHRVSVTPVFSPGEIQCVANKPL